MENIAIGKKIDSLHSSGSHDNEDKQTGKPKIQTKIESSKTFGSHDDGDKQINETKSQPKVKTGYLLFNVGPCTKRYPQRYPPEGGFVKGIDWFFFRNTEQDRQAEYLDCISKLSASEINNQMLIDAAKYGFHSVVEKLMKEYNLDPLYKPPESVKNKRILNAVQEAIVGGYAHIVKVLTGSNNELVIDEYGRTVSDYVSMVGSPIRPYYAKNILGLDLDLSVKSRRNRERQLKTDSSVWNTSTSYAFSESCDIEVVDEDISADVFIKDYYSTGRPVVLRNHAPKEEVDLFSKEKIIVNYPPSKKLTVGSTAYPHLTGQKYCEHNMTISEIENATKCAEMPDLSMVHVFHPKKERLKELYSIYDNGILDKSGGWRKVEEWLGPIENYGLSWQIFFGGDTSGATFHWHPAAFNILYVGIKEWRITPPYYRGLTGMGPQEAVKHLDEKYTLSCTQHPGDQFFIPNYWGHMTLNHGFTAGAAVVITPRLKSKLRGTNTK